jgi:hypothetical protein
VLIEVNVMTTDIATSAAEFVLALDEETLRAEFDELIDSVWVDSPPRPKQSGPLGRRLPRPVDQIGYATTDASSVGLAKTEERERSPPWVNLVRHDESEEGDAYRMR